MSNDEMFVSYCRYTDIKGPKSRNHEITKSIKSAI